MPMLLNIQNIYKNYGKEPMIVPVLKDVSLEVVQGDYIAIMGPSGSGKTTLMNIIGCLDRASLGTYLFEDEDISEMNDDALSDLRLNKIGFVFQNFNLLSSETAQENVALPLIYAGIDKEKRNQRAIDVLNKVGLQDRISFKPSQLSGGQKQRVAIARAIINNPKILLADEPTGALDQASGKQVMELFKSLNDEGVTIIMITHDANVASHAKKFFISLMEKSLKINKEVCYEAFYKKGIIITSICALTLVGIKFYLNSTNKIDVNSVSTLNTGYWDNPSTSTGLVSNSDRQSVLYDASKTITQVFVQEGQLVNSGDPLLSYDLTTLQSAVDTSQLDVEKAQNAIALAEHELKKLLNTTPIPDVVEEPEIQDHTPAPLPGVPEKNGNGLYPYILSLSQAEKNFTAYKIYYTSTTSEAPEKGPHEKASLWKEEREMKESNNTCWYWIEYTYTDGSTNAYDSKDVVEYYSDKQQIPNKEIFLAGTKQNPYVFKLSENQGFVYGKLFLDNANLNQYLRFDVYTNDGDIDSSWLVRCDKFTTIQSINEGDMYSVISHTKEEQKYVEVEQKPSQDLSSGYTEIELAKAIRDKKQELKTLDLGLKKLSFL